MIEALLAFGFLGGRRFREDFPASATRRAFRAAAHTVAVTGGAGFRVAQLPFAREPSEKFLFFFLGTIHGHDSPPLRIRTFSASQSLV